MYSSSLVFFVLLGVFSLPSVSFPHGDKDIPGCRSIDYRCGGNHYVVDYPFRLEGSPSYCGHSGFDLRCIDDSTLHMTIGGKEYVVNSMDYENQTLHLTDQSFASKDQRCNAFTDSIFDAMLFGYTSADANLTVYFNCSSRPGLPLLGHGSLPCFDGDKGSFYTLVPDVGKNCCTSTVKVPIISDYGNDWAQNDLSGALRRGFELKWKAGDGWCKKCTDSNGICWNDGSQANGWGCFCSNSSSLGGSCVPIKEAGGKSKSPVATIGIAIGGVVGALLLGCCLLLIYNRRKKQRQSSLSNLLSRSNSSKISSKKDPELGDTTYHTHIFTYDELEEATNGFNASRELGDGGFGTVYKGKLRDGRTVAVKRLYENNYRRLEQFMNEVVILSHLRHKNLVTLYGCTSRHSRELLLVYEFIPNGTVADHLHGPLTSKEALPWAVRMSIAIETADALAYLHAVEPQIIHRDVKTTNILLDEGFHVKVADFGLSRLFPLDVTHVSTAPQGTPGYVDPEYHQCYQLTDKSDVYSFGVVLVELISSKPAVDISRHRHEINLSNMAITKIQNGQIDQLVDPELGYQSDEEIKRRVNQVAELAFRCLQPDRELRPSIKEVLEGLKSITGARYNAEKEAEVAEVLVEEARLLKNVLPFSPDSVTERWSSRTTTPNTSS